MSTHTIEQFILIPKPILLSSSYWIPSPYYWAVHIGFQAHTIEQFISDSKPILLSSSYWIPSPYYWAVHIGFQAHTIEQFRLDSKPILLSSSWQSQGYKFKGFSKTSNFLILKKNTLHKTRPLKLLDKVCKYKMDPASIVEDTKRTRFCPQTDRRTGVQGETSVHPSTSLSEGYNKGSEFCNQCVCRCPNRWWG